MGRHQAFHLEELQVDRSRSYAEFLRRPGGARGRRRADRRQPRPRGVGRPGTGHRFADVDEDLSVLVVFAPPATPEA